MPIPQLLKDNEAKLHHPWIYAPFFFNMWNMFILTTTQETGYKRIPASSTPEQAHLHHTGGTHSLQIPMGYRKQCTPKTKTKDLYIVWGVMGAHLKKVITIIVCYSFIYLFLQVPPSRPDKMPTNGHVAHIKSCQQRRESTNSMCDSEEGCMIAGVWLLQVNLGTWNVPWLSFLFCKFHSKL